MKDQAKPIVHGRDHRPKGWTGPDDPGGADPLNWLTPAAGGDGLQYNSGTYGATNVGDNLDIETTGSPGIPNDWSTYLHQTVDGSTSADLQLLGVKAISTTANRDTNAVVAQAENDGSNHLATAVTGRAFQTNGGDAIGGFFLGEAAGDDTARGIGVYLRAASDDGGPTYGALTDAPIGFLTPGGVTVEAWIYLVDEGSGNFSLKAETVNGAVATLVSDLGGGGGIDGGGP